MDKKGAQGSNERPSQRLCGFQLEGGWSVIARVAENTMGQTGGWFSVGYIVERGNERAFLKALDFSKAMESERPAEELQVMTSEYLFERNVLELCGTAGLSRVIRVLGHGAVDVDPTLPFGVGRVLYLIFELAERDVRSHIAFSGLVDVAWKLRVLHQMAVGVQQLHVNSVAHQDIKPSNVLLFAELEAKLADLGRAVARTLSSPHDGAVIPGDIGYAPPEFLYGYVAPDWVDRRESCDIYLLGSMIVFFFTGLSMTRILLSKLNKQYWPRVLHGHWSGTYEDVIPHILNAFSLAIDEVTPQLPEFASRDLTQTIRQMCHPHPRERGHPAARRMVGSPVGVERFVSLFDRLSKLAEVRVRAA